ncbi:MAG: helix-turn-helix domain-containing protein [Pseudomonadota bacterium]
MKKRLSVEKQVEIARLASKGVPVAELAERYGISMRSVYRTVRNQRDETASKADPAVTFSFRAPKSEVEGFVELAKGQGFGNPSQAFRSLLRMAQGLVELRPDDIRGFNQSVFLLGKQFDLLNQLAKSVHKGKLKLTEKDRALLSSAIDATLDLREEWQDVLNGAKSRRGYAQRVLAEDKRDG